MALGALAQGLGAAAQGFAPAFGQIMQNRFAEQENTRDRNLQEGYRQEQLGLDREQHAEVMAQRRAEAAADQAYQNASLQLRAADQAIDMARVERTTNNRGLDYRSDLADRAARALTDHMRDRPVMDPGADPAELRRALASWEAGRDELLRIHGFNSEEDLQAAMRGEPAVHNPQESGVARLLRLNEISGYADAYYPRTPGG